MERLKQWRLLCNIGSDLRRFEDLRLSYIIAHLLSNANVGWFGMTCLFAIVFDRESHPLLSIWGDCHLDLGVELPWHAGPSPLSWLASGLHADGKRHRLEGDGYIAVTHDIPVAVLVFRVNQNIQPLEALGCHLVFNVGHRVAKPEENQLWLGQILYLTHLNFCLTQHKSPYNSEFRRVTRPNRRKYPPK